MKITNDNKNNNTNYLNAVAFIADGSLLPLKSGRSILPKPSPPAVPFQSPEGNEQLTRGVTVEVGLFWRRYLNEDSVRGSSECRYIRWFCESWEVKCDQERVLVCAR